MITIELTRQTDLSQPLRMETLRQPLYCGDSEAHCVQVHLVRSGEAVDVSGCGAAGYFLRADGATVVIPGQVTGSVASLTWPRACYEVPGQFSFILRLTDAEGVQQTILALQGSVSLTATEAVVDAAAVIPSLDDLLRQIAALEQATNRAESAYNEMHDALESGRLDGKGLRILGYFATAAGLSGVSNPQRGDAYGVGSAAPYDVYIWDGVNGRWVNNGPLKVAQPTVCGVSVQGGDIPLTAEDIPCGEGSVAQAVSNAAARCTPAKLWEGSWTGGSITVPGIGDWQLLQVGTGTGQAMCLQQNGVQGIGVAASATLHRTIAVRFTVEGDVCTLTTAHYVNHSASGDHGAMTATPVTSIYGLVRKED